MTRGPQQQIDIWKIFMQAQMFNWPRKPILKDKKGKYLKDKKGNFKYGPAEMHSVQGALRPIQLWEYVFPEECLGEVMSMLNIQTNMNLDPKKYSKAYLSLLRKVLHDEKIPTNIPKEKMRRFIEQKGVAIIPIGIRKDPKMDYPQFTPGYFQEGL